MAKFQPSDHVQSTADASQIGTIVRVGPEHAGMQYYVVSKTIMVGDSVLQ